jgi:hypothetical protein
VSDAGLASIAFSEDDLDSEYYLVEIDTEEWTMPKGIGVV